MKIHCIVILSGLMLAALSLQADAGEKPAVSVVELEKQYATPEKAVKLLKEREQLLNQRLKKQKDVIRNSMRLKRMNDQIMKLANQMAQELERDPDVHQYTKKIEAVDLELEKMRKK